MLPSCAICKKRKKKCDLNLPSCKNCESMGAVCEYYDEGLGTNVTRKYLKSLDDRVKELKNEIERYEKVIAKRTNSTSLKSEALVTITRPNNLMRYHLHPTLKSGYFLEGSDSLCHYFGPGSCVCMFYLTSRLLHLKVDNTPMASVQDYSTIPLVKINFDYGIITNDHCRILIANYLTHVYPVYPLLSDEFFHYDLLVKNYPTYEQLFILQILLVSAAHLMRRRMDFVPIKLMLYQKVVELMKNRLNEGDGDALLSLLYMSVYELFDPEEGRTVWKDLALACSLAEKLHLTNLINQNTLPGITCTQVPKKKLLYVLYELETSISLLFGRPPSIVIEYDQIIGNIEDDKLRTKFLNLTSRVKLFETAYDNSALCPLIKCSHLLGSNSPNELFVTSAQLLSHQCNACVQQQFPEFVVNLLTHSLSTIKHYNSTIQTFQAIPYWIALSDITTSTLSIILIVRLHEKVFKNLVDADEVMNALMTGKKLISELSFSWYGSFPVRNFLDLAMKSVEC